MRTFAQMNKTGGAKCPICGTDNDGDVVLIGVAGTEDGNIIQAKQFHLACLELTYDEKNRVIYQVLS